MEPRKEAGDDEEDAPQERAKKLVANAAEGPADQRNQGRVRRRDANPRRRDLLKEEEEEVEGEPDEREPREPQGEEERDKAHEGDDVEEEEEERNQHKGLLLKQKRQRFRMNIDF